MMNVWSRAGVAALPGNRIITLTSFGGMMTVANYEDKNHQFATIFATDFIGAIKSRPLGSVVNHRRVT